MKDDDQHGFDSLDTSILGPGAEDGNLGNPAGFTGGQPAYEWGTGDLALDQRDQAPAQTRRAPQRPEWQGIVRAIVAVHGPSVGLRFRAWAARHEELIGDKTDPQAFALYIETATWRDASADEHRPADLQEYDWAELHMAGLKPLIEAEVQAKREEIADGVRQAYLDRFQALRQQGLVSPEVIELMMAGVSNG